MADVRLTATNPEDSSVVPVACDASGRLLLEERGEGPQGPPGPKGDDGQDGQDGQDGDPFSGNFAGDVTFGGTAVFKDSVAVGKDATSASGQDFLVEGDSFVRIVRRGKQMSINANFNGTDEKSVIQAADLPLVFQSGTSDRMALTSAGQLNIGGSNVLANPLIAFDSVTGGSYFSGTSKFLNDISIGTSAPVDIKLERSGAATFAGGKAGFTAEGYLWCTTRRGDTVILDATVGGAGLWENYTPNTRFDDIRDKLDSNRGETGEMPADTP